MALFEGRGVRPGVAVGPLVWMPEPKPQPAADEVQVRDENAERALISRAMSAVAAELRTRARMASGDARAELEAASVTAEDPAALDLAMALLVERNLTAPRAVHEAYSALCDMLAAVGGYIGAQVDRVEDVRDRVTAAVSGVPMSSVPDPGHPFILAARDLALAEIVTIGPGKVLGIVTTGARNVSAIEDLAGTLAIPAVVACKGIRRVPDSQVVVLDGGSGTLDSSPSPAAIRAAGLAPPADGS